MRRNIIGLISKPVHNQIWLPVYTFTYHFNFGILTQFYNELNSILAIQ